MIQVLLLISVTLDEESTSLHLMSLHVKFKTMVFT